MAGRIHQRFARPPRGPRSFRPVQSSIPQQRAELRAAWRGILETGGARVYGLLVSFVGLLVIARALGPSGHGLVSSTTNWANLLATIASLSLGQVALHLAVVRRDRDWLPEVLGSMLAIGAATTVVVWVGLLATLALRPEVFGGIPAALLLAVAVFQVPAQLWDVNAVHLASASGRLRRYNQLQVAGRTLSVGGALVVVLLGGGAGGAVIALAAGFALQSTLVVGDLYVGAEKRLAIGAATVRALMSGALKLHWNALGTFLILSTDVLVINYFEGPREAGLYQLGSQLFGALSMLPTAAATSLYADVGRLGPLGAWTTTRRVLVQLLALMAGLSALAAVLAPWAIPLVAGHAFDEAIEPFRWLLLAMAGVTITSVLSPQWIGRGWFWQASALTGALGLFKVAVSLVLVPRFGLLGAVYGTVLTYTVFGLVNALVALWCEREWRQSRRGGAEQGAV
jgi:O-antigen/teichoic acid export membrane protein